MTAPDCTGGKCAIPAIEEKLTQRMDYMERLAAAREEAITARLNARDAVTDERLAKMNELREVVNIQVAKGFTREEHNAYMESIERELREFRKFRDEHGAKMSMSAGFFFAALTICAVILSLITLVKHW